MDIVDAFERESVSDSGDQAFVVLYMETSFGTVDVVSARFLPVTDGRALQALITENAPPNKWSVACFPLKAPLSRRALFTLTALNALSAILSALGTMFLLTGSYVSADGTCLIGYRFTAGGSGFDFHGLFHQCGFLVYGIVCLFHNVSFARMVGVRPALEYVLLTMRSSPVVAVLVALLGTIGLFLGYAVNEIVFGVSTMFVALLLYPSLVSIDLLLAFSSHSLRKVCGSMALVTMTSFYIQVFSFSWICNSSTGWALTLETHLGFLVSDKIALLLTIKMGQNLLGALEGRTALDVKPVPMRASIESRAKDAGGRDPPSGTGRWGGTHAGNDARPPPNSPSPPSTRAADVTATSTQATDTAASTQATNTAASTQATNTAARAPAADTTSGQPTATHATVHATASSVQLVDVKPSA